MQIRCSGWLPAIATYVSPGWMGSRSEPRSRSCPSSPSTRESLELPPPYTLLAPVEPPEVWGAGVTYLRSRDARIEESEVEDVYSLVYDADRPELFLKDAGGRRTVGPGEPIGVRSDSAWNVPEPEIALVLGAAGAITRRDDRQRRVVAVDRRARTRCTCRRRRSTPARARSARPSWSPTTGRSRSRSRCGSFPPTAASSTRERRPPSRCAARSRSWPAWLVRENPVPPGSVLLTGTGLVPPADFTLEPGHVVEIRVPGIGLLRNPVVSAASLVSEPARSEAHV